MKMNNLELKEYKNYKVICNTLGENIKGGKSKRLQLKDWERYFEWKKEGYKFIVTEIYNKPLPKPKDNRGKSKGSRNNNIIDIPNFKVDRKDWNSIGVYTITLDNNIYIGSTIAGFRDRFRRHNSREWNTTPHTTDMLENGATFQILWKSDVKDEEYIRYKENQYIKQYRKSKTWKLVNTNEAWNKYEHNKPKNKHSMRYIKIENNNYDKAIKLLKQNNLINN